MRGFVLASLALGANAGAVELTGANFKELVSAALRELARPWIEAGAYAIHAMSALPRMVSRRFALYDTYASLFRMLVHPRV